MSWKSLGVFCLVIFSLKWGNWGGGLLRKEKRREAGYWLPECWGLLPKLFALRQDVSWWVLSFLFLHCCFASSAAASGSISKRMFPLRAFQGVASQHLESFLKEGSQQFSGGLPLLDQDKAGRGKCQAQPGSDHCHLLACRAGLCDGRSKTFR